MDSEDTICAIATPSGGALGVVRLSGTKAISIANALFSKDLTEAEAGTLHHGYLRSPEGETVDEAVLSLFRSPHSYTGEDCVELSCHGSPYVLKAVMRLLIGQGARLARPGEFTQRAFLNGKLDLAQAEAVADLIASETQAQHRMAMSQLRGGFSRSLQELRSQLLRLTSLLELE
ncbi:MAG: tRNA uridine-5-carboxymethylaminomethyl(34) synthesis GTPase MnmE, partial [Prevotellaceae bacterium]|nr:tRNA uridine-5-carboxymethylaminomethyl(34) synthesis GTPase MnmE [Prevotellaceae bacterium]